MSDETIAQFSVEAPDLSDRGAAIDYMTHLARVSAGRAYPLDEAAFRGLAARVFDRTRSLASTMTNHNLLGAGERTRERLGEIDAPTLVVHGTDDPVVPYGNALALVREIRGARLLTLEGAGHDLPRPVWDIVVPAILEHTGVLRRRTGLGPARPRATVPYSMRQPRWTRRKNGMSRFAAPP
jgi:pimeloyl-ACP methyl ester carboxylesterase